jgi:leucyl/phenylalanyl-tRNA---protein transferase
LWKGSLWAKSQVEPHTTFKVKVLGFVCVNADLVGRSSITLAIVVALFLEKEICLKDRLGNSMFDLEQIIDNYAQGYFLMEGEENQLEWYYTNQRTLIPLDSRFRYPKSLQRQINQQRFNVKINGDFNAVVAGCANRPTTWISDELQNIYLSLNQAGWAFSFETWEQDRLAGGILGIAINGVFIGESMFFNIPEGSKVAMVKLVEHLRNRGFVMFDVQLTNPHLERFGSHVVSDRYYQKLLKQGIRKPCSFI